VEVHFDQDILGRKLEKDYYYYFVSVMNSIFHVFRRTKEAQEVYERALFYDSSNPDIYYNVSLCEWL